MKYIIHVKYTDTGKWVTLGFPSPFERGLHAILLASQPVELLFEDR
jgi:hypothetical protein